MWLYLYLTVAPELVNSSLSSVFLLVASCWLLWWLADFKNFWNLQVLGFSPSRHQFVLLLYISGRKYFLVVFDLCLILANCLVTSADFWWRFHWCDLRSVSQDSSFRPSQPTNNQFWLVAAFYLCSGCLRLEGLQHVCYLYKDELFQANLPVTTVKPFCNLSFPLSA